MPATPRTRFDSSPLVRSLADMGVAAGLEPELTFAERLTPWLSWTDAIALAAALDPAPPEPLATERQHAVTLASAAIDAFRRARSELVASITAVDAEAAVGADRAAVAGERTAAIAAAAATATPDRSTEPYREQQSALTERIATMRVAVRSALTDCSAGLGRLAALDAALDAALAVRERRLLAMVPRLPGRRRATASAPDSLSRATVEAVVGAATLQTLLRAELETRLLPLDGMIEALADWLDATTRRP